MTDPNIHRAIGRLEAQMEIVAATLARLDERSAAAADEREGMVTDIAALKDHAKSMVEVTAKFNALQQAIRDGTNQAKGISKGFGLGIAFAAAGTGAAVAGLGKELWKLIFG